MLIGELLVFSHDAGAFLACVAALFVVVGSVFVAVQLPREVRELEEGAGRACPPLEAPQRFNGGLVMFVSQALQILLVSLAVAAFLVVLGALAVGPEVRDAWGVAREDVILRLGLFGEEIELTEEMAGSFSAPRGVPAAAQR